MKLVQTYFSTRNRLFSRLWPETGTSAAERIERQGIGQIKEAASTPESVRKCSHFGEGEDGFGLVKVAAEEAAGAKKQTPGHLEGAKP